MANDLDPLAGIEDEEFLAIEASGLSARHKEFVVHFMRERNATKAARLCGYAAPHHHSAGAVMERSAVRELINSLVSARLRRLQVTPQRIEQELAKVAFASIGDIITVQADGTAYLDFSRAGRETLAAMKAFSCDVVHEFGTDGNDPRQILKMRVTMADKLNALGKLAQIHRMTQDASNGGVNVDIAQAIKNARARAGLGTLTLTESG
ncbi:hypothetical protein FV222_13335 [Methylobacterium sp. WL103]|uniref:terminase small subunit n=1 Tax=Methylobacterium sp. WL103 TaxID=2603891 RepID=UPI0011CCA975|nr:terminase small subunit [Methylobacterium sp. WL103]TXM99215.1 hypothetical protein FV222_13335 [Methylobacterium sp. WL103]